MVFAEEHTYNSRINLGGLDTKYDPKNIMYTIIGLSLATEPLDYNWLLYLQLLLRNQCLVRITFTEGLVEEQKLSSLTRVCLLARILMLDS